jgi:isocitrate/isopropylmalate dehydrogenase
MAPTKILVLEGDGIGPEICAATVDVLKHAAKLLKFDLAFSYADIGFVALKAQGTTFPESVFEQAVQADGIVLGPVSHNDYPPLSEGGRNPSGDLRRRLDLYANIRPARARAGFPPRCGKPIDLVTVRENTEGFYADRSMHIGPGEFMPTPDLALSVRKVTRAGSMRIAETGFALAAKRRKKIVAVHKANVLRVSDGLFLECTREVAARYPDVEYSEQLVDSMAALLVRDSSVYDVIVTTNMFGDILSDQAGEIAGSLGLAASLNAGTDRALAQAAHGSAPTIAGKDLANPTSLVSSSAMLLEWLASRHGNASFANAASAIEAAIDAVLAVPEWRTSDIGGASGTKAFTARVIDAMKPQPGKTGA